MRPASRMAGHRWVNGRRRRVPGMIPHDSESPYTRICVIGSASNREFLRGARGESAAQAGSRPSWLFAWPSFRPSPDDASFPRGTRRPSTVASTGVGGAEVLRPAAVAPVAPGSLPATVAAVASAAPIAPRRISYADSRFTAVSYLPADRAARAYTRRALRP